MVRRDPRPGGGRHHTGPGAPVRLLPADPTACPAGGRRDHGRRPGAARARARGSPACCRTCWCPSWPRRWGGPRRAGAGAQPGGRAGRDSRVLPERHSGRARRSTRRDSTWTTSSSTPAAVPVTGARPTAAGRHSARGAAVSPSWPTWYTLTVDPGKTRRPLDGVRRAAGSAVTVRHRGTGGVQPRIAGGRTGPGNGRGVTTRGDDRRGEGRAEPAHRDQTVLPRRAEVASLLRFAGGLHIVAAGSWSRPRSTPVRRRAGCARRSTSSTATTRTCMCWRPAGLRKGTRYVVRVARDGEALARQTGLLDLRGRPVRGLPAQVVVGRRRATPRPPGGARSWRTAR